MADNYILSQHIHVLSSSSPSVRASEEKMAMTSRFHIVFFVLCTSILCAPTCCKAKAFLPRKNCALFVFGGSVFDAGNNNYFDTMIRSNRPPYGQTFYKYPSGRTSDGRLIPDFIGKGFQSC